MDVMTAQGVAPRRPIMTTFTIDSDNNITAFATREEANATSTSPYEIFASQKELAELAAGWPAERLVTIWNSLAGVVAVEGFRNAKTAISRIWARIQSLGDAVKPKAKKKAKGGTQAKGTPAKAKASRKVTAAKSVPKGKKSVKGEEPATPREGSKTAQVVALLQRRDGATLAKIMAKMGWQRHTVRGFMAGAMKKAGHTVESFKPEGGDRTYRIKA
jgi:hypothetical protein